MSKARRSLKRKSMVEPAQDDYDFVFRTAECKDNDGTFYNDYAVGNNTVSSFCGGNGNKFLENETIVISDSETESDSEESGIESGTNKSDQSGNDYAKEKLDSEEEKLNLEEKDEPMEDEHASLLTILSTEDAPKKGRNLGDTSKLCDICKKIISKLNWARHRKGHFPEKMTACQFCPQKFSRTDTLKKHERHIHANLLVKCTFCDKKFTDKSAVSAHVRSVHEPNKSTKGSSKRSYATMIGRDEVTLKCNVITSKSNKKTSRKRKIISSKGTEANEVKSMQTSGKCIMETENTNLTSRSTNEAKHGIEKKFGCTKCSRKYSTNWNRLRHEQSHISLQRPFKCDICEKTYIWKQDLNRHKLNHLHRKYKCKICHKVLSRRDNLRNHMQSVHQQELPLFRSNCLSRAAKCDTCSKTFRSKQSLVQHRCVLPSNDELNCEICQRKFPNRSNLKRHVQDFHQETEKVSVGNKSKENETGANKSNSEKMEVNSARKSNRLLRHHDNHTELMMTFKCDICEKPCETKRGLSLHKRIHQEARTSSEEIIDYDMVLEDVEMNTECNDQVEQKIPEEFDTKLLKCGICEFRCEFNSSLERHFHHNHLVSVKNGVLDIPNDELDIKIKIRNAH